MADLIDLKRTKAEMKEKVNPLPYSGDVYPYGCQLRLSKDELEKLGLDVDRFSVGEEVMVSAKAKVTSVSESASETYASCSVELQITALAIDEPPKPLNALSMKDYAAARGVKRKS